MSTDTIDTTITTDEIANAPIVASNTQEAQSPIDPAADNTHDVVPTPTAYDKLLQLAASVERAKFALGLKGFFDASQSEINAMIDEVVADVPFADKSQPIWWREPDDATVERAAKAGYEAFANSNGGGTGGWDAVPEGSKADFRAMAKAALCVSKR